MIRDGLEARCGLFKPFRIGANVHHWDCRDILKAGDQLEKERRGGLSFIDDRIKVGIFQAKGSMSSDASKVKPTCRGSACERL